MHAIYGFFKAKQFFTRLNTTINSLFAVFNCLLNLAHKSGELVAYVNTTTTTTTTTATTTTTTTTNNNNN